MSGDRKSEKLTDTDAERRATDAIRRALTTPYKPQSEMKIGKKKEAPKKRRPKSAKSDAKS